MYATFRCVNPFSRKLFFWASIVKHWSLYAWFSSSTVNIEVETSKLWLIPRFSGISINIQKKKNMNNQIWTRTPPEWSEVTTVWTKWSSFLSLHAWHANSRSTVIVSSPRWRKMESKIESPWREVERAELMVLQAYQFAPGSRAMRCLLSDFTRDIHTTPRGIHVSVFWVPLIVQEPLKAAAHPCNHLEDFCFAFRPSGGSLFKRNR